MKKRYLKKVYAITCLACDGSPCWVSSVPFDVQVCDACTGLGYEYVDRKMYKAYKKYIEPYNKEVKL